MINAWSGVKILMSSFSVSLMDILFDLDKDSLRSFCRMQFCLFMKSVDSCTAKDYSTKGCLLEFDLKDIFGLPGDSKAVVGVTQCFSTTSSISLPAVTLAVTGDFGMAFSPVPIMCERNSDCPMESECLELYDENTPDVFDLIIWGDKLTDVFKEADADKDGKLTYEEWETRMGKLVPADELKRLFEECDTDKNGSLDTTEFATGMAGKYEIQWAQVSISSSLPSPAFPVYHHSSRPAVLAALICMRGPNKSVYMCINFRIPKRTTSEMRRI